MQITPHFNLYQCLYQTNNQTHQTMKKLVILTGGGMSAESGISTFRDAGGLWEK
jgi:NAD-dependent SIR2 family protein deacetylase